MIAGKASTRQQSVQRQTGRAHLVKQTQTRQQGAMPRPTASVMQALQGRMEDRARSVRRANTKKQQEPTLVSTANLVNTKLFLAQASASHVLLVLALGLAATIQLIVSVILGELGRMVACVQSVTLVHTRAMMDLPFVSRAPREQPRLLAAQIVGIVLS